MTMDKNTRFSIFLLRISIGFYFLYAGMSKILNSSWSSVGYLTNSKTFAPLYHWFASPVNIGWVDFINQWGLAVVGIFLILGLWVRYASIGGIVLMVLYYFPTLSFPYAGSNAYIIDNHVIFIVIFVVLIAAKAGRYFGIDEYLNKR